MDVVWAAEATVENANYSDSLWRLGMVLAAIALLAMYARFRKARQRPLPPPAKELREIAADRGRYHDPADRALVELVEAGREINAQVDTKVRFLNRLVKDADDRIARLESLLAAVDGLNRGGEGDPGPGSRIGEIPDAGLSSASRRYRSGLQARIVSLKNEGRNISEIASATGLSIVEIQLALEHAESSRG